MKRFLRMFSAFRELEAELAESNRRALALQDANLILQTKCDVAAASEAQARQDASECLKRQVDMLAVNSGLGSVYGVIGAQDRRTMQPAPEPAFITGRQFVDQKTREFYDQAEDQFLNGSPDR